MMELIAGDDIIVEIDLTKGGQAFVIPPTAKVKAVIVDKTNSQVLIGPITATGLEMGSNWANSRVICIFPAAITGNVKSTTQGKIQIQVIDTEKMTWITDVLLTKGLVK